MFNFSDKMEFTLYGFIWERKVMDPQDFREKRKDVLKLHYPEVYI